MRAALGLTVYCALLGSLLELGLAGYLRLFQHHRLVVAKEAVWWIPLVLLTGAVLLVAVTWGLGRWIPALRKPASLSGVAVAWSVASPLLVIQPVVHPASLLLIAIGSGVAVARLGERIDEVGRRATRQLPWAFAVVVGLAIGLTAAERRLRFDYLTPPGSAPRDPWNVLILVLDTVRAIDLSLFGHSLPTSPSLDSLARSSVVFDRAIAPAPWTLPTHGSLFTGRWPSELWADWRQAEPTATTTLAEVFRAAGYRTGGFVANVEMLSYESGLAQGFETYQDHPTTVAEMLHSAAVTRFVLQNRRLRHLVGFEWTPGRKSAAEIRRAFLDWLDDAAGEGRERAPERRPFFAFLNLFDAHLPYDPAPEDRGRFGPIASRPKLLARTGRAFAGRTGADGDSASVRGAHARYLEAIASIDREIGALVQELRARGQLDRTVLVVTADHGELFGERGMIDHGHSLHANLLWVPLLIRAPGAIPAGVRVPQPVSLRDVARTVLELAGVEGPLIEGSSLFAGGTVGRSGSPAVSMVSWVPAAARRLPVSRGDMASIVVDSLHYILNGDQTEEVFSLRSDPYEQLSLMSTLPATERDRLRTLLRSVWHGKASLAPEPATGLWVERPAF